MKKALIPVLLFALAMNGCDAFKTSSDDDSDRPNDTATDRGPVQPIDPDVPALRVQADTNFVTWDTAIDADDKNQVGFNAENVQQVRIQYHFRFENPKYLKVISVHPSVSCTDGALTDQHLFLETGDSKIEMQLKDDKVTPVEANKDYVLEVVQNMTCAKATGAIETIIWTGKNSNIRPALAQKCTDSQGKPMTVFIETDPSVFKTSGQRFLGPNDYCGNHVDADPVKCESAVRGSMFEATCATENLPENWSYQFGFEAWRGSGQYTCMKNGVAQMQEVFQNCITKVVDLYDFR